MEQEVAIETSIGAGMPPFIVPDERAARVIRPSLVALLLRYAGLAYAADPPPSVLVQTKAAEQGALPALVEAYGTAAPRRSTAA